MKALRRLSSRLAPLRSSTPWLAYWQISALCILNSPVAATDPALAASLSGHIAALFSPLSGLTRTPSAAGGFSGAPGDIPNLASTYSASLALVSLGTPAALATLVRHRAAIAALIAHLRAPNGSFAMHQSGEADTRAAYCAATIAALLGLPRAALFPPETAAWLSACAALGGGYGAEPGDEHHGGYTFCAAAALVLLGHSAAVDAPRLRRWVAMRQMPEGGFSGRAHKLVDACYAWWSGASAAVAALAAADAAADPSPEQLSLLRRASLRPPSAEPPPAPAPPAPRRWGDGWPECVEVVDDAGGWDGAASGALQMYLLAACEDAATGGWRDKPGKGADLYHTHYALAGMALAQDGRAAAVLGARSNAMAEVHELLAVVRSALPPLLAATGGRATLRDEWPLDA